jgi:hypothetical protein
LIDFALGKERNLLARRADGAFAGRSDAEGDATHVAQAHDHALLGVGFHDAFDHLARMIRCAILKKCHDYLNKQPFKVRASRILSFEGSVTA